MLAPLYTGSSPPSAIYKIPDELWLLIISHIPHLSPWHIPNLGYDDHFLPPCLPHQALKTTFQAESIFVQLHYAAWQELMRRCMLVCRAWAAELRREKDQWLLFKSAEQLRAFLRSGPPVEHLKISRVDVHYDPCFPDILLQPFLARLRGLEQLHLNQLNNNLAFDIPLPLLDTLSSMQVTSISFPKRGVPAQALPLLARLPLTQLSLGADKLPPPPPPSNHSSSPSSSFQPNSGHT